MRRSPSIAPRGNKTETGGSMPIRFILNGEVCVEDSVSSSMTVLDYLRERRGLTGPNTGKVPNTSATAASSGSDLNGMGAIDAAQKIKIRMTKSAAEHFEVDGGDIEFRNNHVYADNKCVPFPESAKLTWQNHMSLSSTGFYTTPYISWDDETMTGRPFYYFPYGACVSEVAIGEPPLFPALSAWLAIRDAISSLSDHRFANALNTPATAERILDAVEDMGARAGNYTHV